MKSQQKKKTTKKEIQFENDGDKTKMADKEQKQEQILPAKSSKYEL